MIRTTTFAAIILTAGIVTICRTNENTQQVKCCEVVTVFDADTAEWAASYEAFKSILNREVDALAQRETKLTDAVLCVRQAAERHCAVYLERVQRAERCDNLEVCIARNLVGHIGSTFEVDPRLAPRMRELEAELGAYVREREAMEID